jgi:hypothetical protein
MLSLYGERRDIKRFGGERLDNELNAVNTT